MVSNQWRRRDWIVLMSDWGRVPSSLTMSGSRWWRALHCRRARRVVQQYKINFPLSILAPLAYLYAIYAISHSACFPPNLTDSAFNTCWRTALKMPSNWSDEDGAAGGWDRRVAELSSFEADRGGVPRGDRVLTVAVASRNLDAGLNMRSVEWSVTWILKYASLIWKYTVQRQWSIDGEKKRKRVGVTKSMTTHETGPMTSCKVSHWIPLTG